jgi:hypothetical protein
MVTVVCGKDDAVAAAAAAAAAVTLLLLLLLLWLLLLSLLYSPGVPGRLVPWPHLERVMLCFRTTSAS